MTSADHGSAVHIRQLQDGDRDALIDLWIAAWQVAMPSIDFEVRRGWIAAFLAEPAHQTLVAHGAAPLGFISLEGRLLHQLVVVPHAQGTGVARALLQAAITRSPEGLDLEVNQDNGRAVRFYEREGFACVGASRNPASGLATWRMRRRAAPSDS